MSEDSAKTSTKCSNCGAMNTGSHRCTSCGASLVARKVESLQPQSISESPAMHIEGKVEVARITFNIIGILCIFFTVATFIAMIINMMFSNMPSEIVFNKTVIMNVFLFCAFGYLLRKFSGWFSDLAVSR